jgi:uncharacterized membrane protein YqjE
MGVETINPLDAMNLLRSAGGALVTQATIYGELLGVEWSEEKRRLMKMTGLALAAFACVLCTMLAAGALAVALAWDTAWRLPVAAGLAVLYALGAFIAWQRFQALAAQGERSFSATREELAADLALLRGQL